MNRPSESNTIRAPRSHSLQTVSEPIEPLIRFVNSLPKLRSRKDLHYLPTPAHPSPAHFPVFPFSHTDIVVERILAVIIVTS